jgi:hypothetical protein
LRREELVRRVVVSGVINETTELVAANLSKTNVRNHCIIDGAGLIAYNDNISLLKGLTFASISISSENLKGNKTHSEGYHRRVVICKEPLSDHSHDVSSQGFSNLSRSEMSLKVASQHRVKITNRRL